MPRRKPTQRLAPEGERQIVLLEDILTSPNGLSLTTASPLQRAICRLSDGQPLGELWRRREVRRALGAPERDDPVTGPPPPPPEVAPQIMGVFCGIRGAKSTMAAGKAIATSQNCRTSFRSGDEVIELGAGDMIEVPVLAPTKNRAQAVMNHLLKNIQRSPYLASLLYCPPTADTVTLRHPTGRPVAIRITALSKHGQSVVGAWVAGAVFDEAPLMGGESDSVANLEESLGAIQGRLLEGGQIWLIGSPYAPFGPVYDLDQKHFGKPNPGVIVVRAPAPAMNPVFWTPAELEKRRKTMSPRRWRTDVLAKYSEPEESLVSLADLERATRKIGKDGSPDLPPQKGIQYVAAMDPGMRSNAWTLIILGCHGVGGPGGMQPLYSVAVARQWVGTKDRKLQPATVLREIADLCATYNLDTVHSDQYQIDAMADLAQSLRDDEGAALGLNIVETNINAKNRIKMAEAVVFCLEMGTLELPTDRLLRSDLLAARKRVTQNGVTLYLPKSGDGRHCDYVPALMLALAHPPEPPRGQSSVVEHPPEWQSVIDGLERRESLDAWEALTQSMTGGSDSWFGA